MELQVTGDMAQVLCQASKDSQLNQDVQEAAAAYATASAVPWQVMKTVVSALNEHRSPDDPLLLHVLCANTNIVLPQPAAKPPNPELEARRKMLQAKVEEQQYAAMVADITEKEREAEDRRGMLPTYQAQLTFGLHVVVMMFTFFALGYWGSKWFWGWDELWAGLLGAMGLTAGMLLETVLLIIRSNMPMSPEEKYPHLVDPKLWNKPRQAAGMAAATSSSSSASSAQLKESKKKR